MSIRISHTKFPIYCNHCNTQAAAIYQANDQQHWAFHCWQCGLRQERQRASPMDAWQDVTLQGGFGVTCVQLKASGPNPVSVVRDLLSPDQALDAIQELVEQCRADRNIECAYYTQVDESGRYRIYYLIGTVAQDRSMLRRALQRIAEDQIESQLRRAENMPYINWDLLKYGRKAG